MEDLINMIELHKIHDNFFKKTFNDVNNIKDFLRLSLPDEIKNEIDYDCIKIDTTGYISGKLKGSFSDIIVKTKLKRIKYKSIATDADIYFLFEHKSYKDNKVLIQLLKYMYLMWQKDSDENKPLRVILPLVFYHGKKKWDIPLEFNKQFKVKNELLKFLLNFRYILLSFTGRKTLDFSRRL